MELLQLLVVRLRSSMRGTVGLNNVPRFTAPNQRLEQ